MEIEGDFTITKHTNRAGETRTIIRTANSEYIRGIQFALNFGPRVIDLLAHQVSGLPFSIDHNFGLHLQGEILFRWDNPDGIKFQIPAGLESFRVQITHDSLDLRKAFKIKQVGFALATYLNENAYQRIVFAQKDGVFRCQNLYNFP